MPRSPEAMPPLPASQPESGAGPEKKKRHLRSVSEEEAAEDLTHELDDPKDPERWYKMYKEIAPDMTGEAHEIDPKDSARWEKMYREIAPDMTAEAHEVDPKDAARYAEARKAIDAMPDMREIMPSSPPPIPEPKKKSAWQRFKGLFGR